MVRKALETKQLEPPGDAAAAAQGKVVALCIGVSKYKSSPLKNAAKDAQDLGSALLGRGSGVMLLTDPTITELRDSVDKFCYQKNHQADQAAEKHGYAIETVISKMEEQGCPMNLVMVDACRSPNRDLKLVRSAGQSDKDSAGWGNRALPRGTHTLICNACKSLKVASDGVPGHNGIYTGGTAQEKREAAVS
ncbi:hypothetical protein COO60DRAFT_1638095 [Scenedesmus sp. NREL 46B-D3]|nr:hypothetical protein COO60DRAFT_1638095 [Scenedesmus sp. NREL 46B-D3]